jgi:hypothetical protein
MLISGHMFVSVYLEEYLFYKVIGGHVLEEAQSGSSVG